MTTAAKITATANRVLPNPSINPTAVAKALTRAECELGIPPVATRALKSIRCVICQRPKNFTVWAASHAKSALCRAVFCKIVASSMARFVNAQLIFTERYKRNPDYLFRLRLSTAKPIRVCSPDVTGPILSDESPVFHIQPFSGKGPSYPRFDLPV